MNNAKTGKKKKHIVRKIILWLLLLAILAGAGWYAYSRLKSEYTVTYDTYTATVGSISNSLSFSGSFNLKNSASCMATADTTVRKVYVAAGDSVKKGDKLIRLADGETFTADFDGKVNTLNVEEDDDVTMGTELLSIADFTNMKVSVRVDEYDIGEVNVGQACTVTATATEKTYDSTISAINYISQSGGNVAYYAATIDVTVDEDDGIYPGMQATVTIPQEEANNVIILKEDALSFDANNSAYVWMYNDEGVLEQKPVEIGVSNGNYVEIKSGLSEGDTVYVAVETEVSTAASLLGSIFGGTQINQQAGGGMHGGGDFSGGNMPDMSSMPSGSFGGGSGSSTGSGYRGGASGGGMGGGN